MNLIFNYDQKNFLTEKRTARVALKTKKGARKKFQTRQTATIPILQRTGLGIDFPASELTELACARNFPPLRAESTARKL
jgi:hypothetical protein